MGVLSLTSITLMVTVAVAELVPSLASIVITYWAIVSLSNSPDRDITPVSPFKISSEVAPLTTEYVTWPSAVSAESPSVASTVTSTVPTGVSSEKSLL